MSPTHAARALVAIIYRELLRFLQQRERFVASLVRPLVWLLVFASGFRAVVDDGADYRTYIVPGLCAMIQLFHGMQSSLSMVYDREMGSMRILMCSPLPRSYLLFCRLLASCVVSIAQVYVFLGVAALVGVPLPLSRALVLLGPLVAGGLLLGALGMVLAGRIRQLENFAGVMNFVIFPLFFLSPALYPLARMAEDAPYLYALARINPFTHVVEGYRATLDGSFAPLTMVIVLVYLALVGVVAVRAYDPARALRPKGR